MTAQTIPYAPSITTGRPGVIPIRETLIAGGAFVVTALVLAALVRGGHAVPATLARYMWLTVHLATVIPALPLGAYLLVRRKGDRLHRLLGRTWAGLMMVTALASFGVRTSGQLSWIHLFSVLVLVTVPRAVMLAVRGDIGAHRTMILRLYAGLVIAGLFTFLPGRLLGHWLYG